MPSKYAMTQPIKVYDRKKGQREIMAMPSRSPYLAVHGRLLETTTYDDIFTITHLPTGLAMVPWIPSKKVARTLAAALAALPVDWSKSKQEDVLKELQSVPWAHRYALEVNKSFHA